MLLGIFMLSCGNNNTKRIRYVCSCKEKKEVQKFITKNILKANNYSDEEMEDVIEQLEETGIKIICHQEITDQNRAKIKLDSCSNYYEFY